MKNQKTLAIIYSEAKREDFPTREQYLTEAEVYERAKMVKPCFQKLGYRVKLLPGTAELPRLLKKIKPSLILNLVDSVRGKENLAAVIPAVLDLMKIPYLGTGQEGLLLNASKQATKKVLQNIDVPIPKFQLITSLKEKINPKLKFPLITKLNEIHGSVAISEKAISENKRHLRARIKYLMATYGQGVLVEEFIVGRELTAYVLEGRGREVFVAEKKFGQNKKKYKIASYEANWGESDDFLYQKISGLAKLEKDARRAFSALKMNDYAKFDIRLDQKNNYYFIDCNANPAFGPIESECAISRVLKEYKISFEQIIKKIIANAEKRISKS